MRAFFFRRSWRERILLLVVLGVAVAIWLSSVTGRVGSLRENWGGVSVALAQQAGWLADAAANQARLDERLAQVKQGRALNANQLAGQLDAVVKRQRFPSYRLDPPTSERRPPVVIHAVALTIEKVDLAAFGAFVDDLRASLPLVNIEQVVMTPDRRTPAQIDIRLKLSGLELLP